VDPDPQHCPFGHGIHLDEEWMVAERDDAGKVGEVPLHLLRQDVTLVRHRLQGTLLTQSTYTLHIRTSKSEISSVGDP
jgi:hypothetical protein